MTSLNTTNPPDIVEILEDIMQVSEEELEEAKGRLRSILGLDEGITIRVVKSRLDEAYFIHYTHPDNTIRTAFIETKPDGTLEIDGVKTERNSYHDALSAALSWTTENMPRSITTLSTSEHKIRIKPEITSAVLPKPKMKAASMLSKTNKDSFYQFMSGLKGSISINSAPYQHYQSEGPRDGSTLEFEWDGKKCSIQFNVTLDGDLDGDRVTKFIVDSETFIVTKWGYEDSEATNT